MERCSCAGGKRGNSTLLLSGCVRCMQRAACGEWEAVIQERQSATGWRSPRSLLPADDFAPSRAIALYDGFLDQERTRAFLPFSGSPYDLLQALFWATSTCCCRATCHGCAIGCKANSAAASSAFNKDGATAQRSTAPRRGLFIHTGKGATGALMEAESQTPPTYS